MITYEALLARLRGHEDRTYRDFHKNLLKNEKIKVIGVRVPILRKLAKEYKGEIDVLLSFPDEFYEVTFLKCAAAGLLPYEKFIAYIDRLVPLLDNWATCDCFSAPCIKKHKGEFLPYIEKYFESDGEFMRRYALVTLLHYYVEREYLSLIFAYLRRCGDEPYYVVMAGAWLLAEVLVKFYDAGVDFLRERCLSAPLTNKAIQKARESFRLTPACKEELLRFKK